VIHLVGVAWAEIVVWVDSVGWIPVDDLECASAFDDEEVILLVDAVTVTKVVVVVVNVGTREDEDTGGFGGSGWSIREILKKTTGDSRSVVNARPARSRLEMAPVL
jgi:hypothetical protein